MLSLAWALTRAGGWSRAALLAVCTALVSGLLFVAVALLRVSGDGDLGLAPVAADSGTRGGVVLTALLLTVAPLLLLNQVVRLGTASRSRRLAALRVAGATPSEVRQLGAVEVGIPTSAGSVLGLAVYVVLQAVLSFGSLALVPRGLPPWWVIAPVIVTVSGLGFATGALTSIASPFGLVRQQRRAAPRPWGFALIVIAIPLTFGGFALGHAGDPLVFGAIALVILAMIALSPWLAYRMATRTASRASDVPTLLAARRIVAEPGAAGRAAAGIGGIALVSGGVATFITELVAADYGDSFHLVNAVIVSVLLVVALLVVSGSMAVHSVESLLGRRREVAFLAATGMPTGDLERTQRRELAIVAQPLAMAGSVFGAAIVSVVAGVTGEVSAALMLVALAVGVGVTVVLARSATAIAVRIVRPWARQAAVPQNLRTE